MSRNTTEVKLSVHAGAKPPREEEREDEEEEGGEGKEEGQAEKEEGQADFLFCALSL
ncbi:MAG: hypothetical protein SFV32_02340 [Opitutaceae bacterium]|nr:hypothetical protein [Opitutaceae bacterium]